MSLAYRLPQLERFQSLWRGEIWARRRFDPAQIAGDVAEQYGLTLAELRQPTRSHRISHPRHHAMWALRETGKFSFPWIANFFRLRDHTTVMYGVRAHARRTAVE